MDFSLSEDQRAFAQTAQALFADYCDDDQLRAFDLSGEPFMSDLWAQCTAMGLTTMVLPEEAGGLGLGITELAAVLEQQGRALALVPLWEQQLSLAAIVRFGSRYAHEQWLAEAVSGEKIVTVSLEGNVFGRACLEATREGGAWRLTGLAPAVPLGAQASRALLVARRDGALRLVLVDLADTAIAVTPGTSQHHLAVADLQFEGVRVEDSAWLDEAALAWFEPRAVACLAALQMGVSARQLERAVDYVSERRQFDRVIGTFQLVAGQMADGHIAVEALRTSLAQLVYRLDAGQGALPQGWATRWLACEAGHRVGHMAQHVHGGIGVDVTFPIHRFLYWSRVLGLALGGAEHNLAKLGDWLANHDTLGWKYDHAEDQTV
ncbi:MAG TPA: acyl-CoA dehydrogenase family protein [Paraburkholderia sp.]|jgi:alkylation response protein AidB-like acyl-CoA dehydrogenase|uniref:acyl-CoA dehydrogenase family protein n=1 Tax=Paraburkholderia sp. TaxID=1926495 RepID=UPI002B46295A|nr:acyl-CoA dehydrogenase family protein [Paraburkholderia sp.]HKR44928.1 acyl-CoA dehydrogenase family protein [Paraburkholderia sp.]